MDQDERYNPWKHLRSLTQVTFGITRLPAGRGWWIPSEKAIVLDDRLTRVERRVVLAHELAHFDLGHQQMAASGGRVDKRARLLEVEADRLAARRLIHIIDLAALLAESEDTWAIAEALDVDVDVLWTRLKHLHPAERGVIRQARRRAAPIHVA